MGKYVEKHYCCHKLQRRGRYSRSEPCNNRASLCEVGYWYCKRHSPRLQWERQQEKLDAKEWEREALQHEQDNKVTLQPYEAKVLEAVRCWAHGEDEKNLRHLRIAQYDLEKKERGLRESKSVQIPRMYPPLLRILESIVRCDWADAPHHTWVQHSVLDTWLLINMLIERGFAEVGEPKVYDGESFNTYRATPAGRVYLREHKKKVEPWQMNTDVPSS